MPDPFATHTGRFCIIALAAVGGAIGGGYITSDDLDDRLEQARLEGRVTAIEAIVGGMKNDIKANARDIGSLNRIVDQHGNRLGILERESE